MLSQYCPECAQPNFYTLTKPKFCAFCGTSLDGLAKSLANIEEKPRKKLSQVVARKQDTAENINRVKKSKKQLLAEQRHKRQIEEEAELEYEEGEVLDVSNLEAQISGKPAKLTLGELFKQGKTGFERRIQGESRSESLKIFRQEAQGKTKPIDLSDEEAE